MPTQSALVLRQNGAGIGPYKESVNAVRRRLGAP
jgi:hypothetical protein